MYASHPSDTTANFYPKFIPIWDLGYVGINAESQTGYEFY
jgi:hypothetical protein